MKLLWAILLSAALLTLWMHDTLATQRMTR